MVIYSISQASMRIIFSIMMASLILCIACNTVGKVYDTIGPEILKTHNIGKVRFDGLYSVHDTSPVLNEPTKRIYQLYISYKPLLFINDSIISGIDEGGATDSTELLFRWYKERHDFLELIGKYNIRNDTIRAKLPTLFNGTGMTQKVCMAYYEGVLRGGDTIINWHMVPPYPKADQKLNNNFKNQTACRELRFIESRELFGLDSLYRQKLKEQEGEKSKE